MDFQWEIKVDRHKPISTLSLPLFECFLIGCFLHNLGMSYFDLKNNLLADYIANLAYVMKLQVDGQMGTSESDEAILRIAEDRTALERMRPLDKKLKYQKDKLIRGKLAKFNI